MRRAAETGQHKIGSAEPCRDRGVGIVVQREELRRGREPMNATFEYSTFSSFASIALRARLQELASRNHVRACVTATCKHDRECKNKIFFIVRRFASRRLSTMQCARTLIYVGTFSLSRVHYIHLEVTYTSCRYTHTCVQNTRPTRRAYSFLSIYGALPLKFHRTAAREERYLLYSRGSSAATGESVLLQLATRTSTYLQTLQYL